MTSLGSNCLRTSVNASEKTLEEQECISGEHVVGISTGSQTQRWDRHFPKEYPDLDPPMCTLTAACWCGRQSERLWRGQGTLSIPWPINICWRAKEQIVSQFTLTEWPFLIRRKYKRPIARLRAAHGYADEYLHLFHFCLSFFTKFTFNISRVAQNLTCKPKSDDSWSYWPYSVTVFQPNNIKFNKRWAGFY